MRYLAAFFFLFTILQPHAALAEYSVDDASVEQLPPLVVIATRMPNPPGLDPATITVITREEIERSGAPNVAELLRFVPGVDVRVSGQTGGQASVFLRGANSNHTLVLVDGIRINSAFSGTYDFSSLTVANVERVEVISGPQSLLYGSEALGGIINIVTRRGTAGTSGSVSVAAGSYARTEGRGFVSLGGGKARASLSGSWLETDNDRINSVYRARDLALSGDWDVSPQLSLGLQGSIFDSQSGVPNDRFTNDPNDESRILNRLAVFSLDGTPSSWWNLGLSVSHSRDQLDFDGLEPNPPYFSGDAVSTTLGKRDLVDLQNVLTFGAGHRVLLGGTYEHTQVDHDASSSYGEVTLEPDQESKSLFGAYGYQGGDRFEANVGGRLDDYTSFGSHETWRAGGRLNLTTGTLARASVGTGFRAPTLADLFYPGFSNPELQPEESLGWDLGLEARFVDDRLLVSAAWFGNSFDNLIAYSGETYRPENIAEAKTGGLETGLEWRVGAGWNMRATYTWLASAEDLISGAPLLRRSEHSGSLNVHGPVSRGIKLDARVVMVGSSADRDFSSFPAADVTNAGYVKWDLGATVQVVSRLSAILRVENLFDAQYEEAYGFPALGRIARVGLTYDF